MLQYGGNPIDRKKEAYMSTANHLTIRDYFDQVFTGKQSTWKVFSPSMGSANASGTGLFHRMLASRQMQGVGNASVKSTGLTIVDYLANPLGVKGRYQRSPELLSSEATADRSPGRPATCRNQNIVWKRHCIIPIGDKTCAIGSSIC